MVEVVKVNWSEEITPQVQRRCPIVLPGTSAVWNDGCKTEPGDAVDGLFPSVTNAGWICHVRRIRAGYVIQRPED